MTTRKYYGRTYGPKRPDLPDDPDKIKPYTSYLLMPKNASVKSFYGKAAVSFEPDEDREVRAVLQSYETYIATCDRLGVVEKTPATDYFGKTKERKLSHTSARHFREFKAQAPELAAVARLMMERIGIRSDVL